MTQAGESLLSILFKLVNFGILLAILLKFAGKPVKRFFLERHKKVKQEIGDKEKMLQEMDSLISEIKTKIGRLDLEIQEIRKKVLEEAYAERDRIIKEAEALADKLREQVSLTKEQEIKEMRRYVMEEVAKRTVEEAERLVVESIKKEDHARLVKAFIERLRNLN